MMVKFAPDYTIIEVKETLEGLELETSAVLILIKKKKKYIVCTRKEVLPIKHRENLIICPFCMCEMQDRVLIYKSLIHCLTIWGNTNTGEQ
jgi:hypothetical protein